MPPAAPPPPFDYTPVYIGVGCGVGLLIACGVALCVRARNARKHEEQQAENTRVALADLAARNGYPNAPATAERGSAPLLGQPPPKPPVVAEGRPVVEAPVADGVRVRNPSAHLDHI